MDGGVPDSDDEGHASYHSNKQNIYAEGQPLEKIYSDDEGDAWAIAANYCTRLEATPQPQAPASKSQKMFTLGRKATQTGAVKGPRQLQAGRKLVSSAVAARQQASANVEEETTHQKIEFGGVDWSSGGSMSKSSKQSIPAPLVAARPAFVGRAPPPALRPLPEARRAPAVPATSTAAPGPTEQNNVNKPRNDFAAREEQNDRSTAPLATSNKPSYAPPPAAITAAVAGSNFGTGMTTHRNDDGMNVVISKRKRSGDDETTAPTTKIRATVNSGWGNNFVRIDMKVG